MIGDLGGDIIIRRLPFAVLLILSLFMACIAGASAADVDTAQTQTGNNSTVHENTEIQTNSTYNETESVALQNSTEEKVNAVEDTGTDIKNSSTNQTATPAAASTNSTSKNSTSTETNTKNAVSTAVNNSQNSTSTSNNTNAQNLKAAAGETKTKVTSTSFTANQINDASTRVKAYIETNHRLPNYVTIGTTQVQMSDFLKLLTANLLQLNSGKKSSITLTDINDPAKPTESIKSGSITKSGYLDLAKRVNAFIASNGVLPNYASSSLGKLNYQSLIYTFSKILAFYDTNGRLPNYVTVKPWSTVGTSSSSSSTPVPAALQQYLKATTNCQVTNSQIQALAKSITSGKTSTYNKAAAIFNWVNDNINYVCYTESQRGAVTTLTKKSGNCCDITHLLIALERAAGIPARYEHGYCKFSSGWCGHVWAQVYVDGKWYRADASNSRNTFGVINSWNTATATIYGTYLSLPF